MIDKDLLQKICEENDNDIRSCLSALEFLSRRRRSRAQNLKDEIFLVKKEMAKNLYDVIDDIIMDDKNKSYKGTAKQKNKKFK